MKQYKNIIVDADNVCWKNYYKLSNLSYGGIKTGAIFGMLQSVLSYYKDYKPDDVYLTWSMGSTYRKSIYPEYKATRKKDEHDDYFVQQHIIEDLFKFLGIKQYRIKGYEADDIIAVIANECSCEEEPTLIISADKDLLQLIDKYVTIKKDDDLYDEAFTEFKLGIKPKDIPLYLSIVGDRSDNIVGVLQVGPKKATTLIQEYGQERLLRLVRGQEFPSWRDPNVERVRLSEEVIERNLKLIKLKPFIEEIDPENNILYMEPNLEEVLKILEKYNITSLLSKVITFYEERYGT